MTAPTDTDTYDVVIIGAGIFKTPSLVAKFSGSAEVMIAAWILGGVISVLGALCYAELASTHPNAGLS